MGRVSRWSPEFREEAVRLHRESGDSIAAVARRLGVGTETMRRWVRDAEIERGARDGVTVAEQAEIRELRRQVRRLEEEKLISRGRQRISPGRQVSCHDVPADRSRARAPRGLLAVLGAGRHPPGLLGLEQTPREPEAARRRADQPQLLRAWTESDETYGAPRLHAELRLGAALQIGKKRVARLMREL